MFAKYCQLVVIGMVAVSSLSLAQGRRAVKPVVPNQSKIDFNQSVTDEANAGQRRLEATQAKVEQIHENALNSRPGTLRNRPGAVRGNGYTTWVNPNYTPEVPVTDITADRLQREAYLLLREVKAFLVEYDKKNTTHAPDSGEIAVFRALSKMHGKNKENENDPTITKFLLQSLPAGVKVNRADQLAHLRGIRTVRDRFNQELARMSYGQVVNPDTLREAVVTNKAVYKPTLGSEFGESGMKLEQERYAEACKFLSGKWGYDSRRTAEDLLKHTDAMTTALGTIRGQSIVMYAPEHSAPIATTK